MDSYAVIGYLENEPFAEKIEAILKKAQKNRLRAYLHAIHLGEVYYITHREQGQQIADIAYSRIKAWPVRLVDQIGEDLLLKAATLKSKYPISYANSFAAALSVLLGCPLLTGDPEFKVLESDGVIAVDWLGKLKAGS
jgi:predicted nucleic acid-binding protein